jgi:sugar lactone lactonase YvrE
MNCLVVLLALGAGPAKVEFDYPLYLTVGPDRAIYVSDQNIPAVYKIGPDGSVKTIYRGKKLYRTPLYRPRGLCVEKSGSLLVCDPATYDVFRLSQDGVATPLSGKKTKLLNGMETTLGEFINPEGVVVASDGTIFVTDIKYSAVFRIGADRKPVKHAAVPAPRGLAIDKDGSIVVISMSEAQLRRVAKDGKVTNIVEGRPFGFPLSVCVRGDGNYVVSDNYGRTLWLVTPKGKAEKLLDGEPFKKCTGVAIDEQGNLYVADPEQRKIILVSPEKKLTVVAEAK